MSEQNSDRLACLAAKNKNVQTFIQTMQGMKQSHIDEMRHPSMYFQTPVKYLSREEMTKYPNSPTAKKYMMAFDHFWAGFACLHSYDKDLVISETDCDQLEPGFYAYAVGYILENLMIGQFSPPDNTMSLLEQYLKMRPNDVFAAYFNLRLFLRIRDDSAKKLKNDIIACEILAHKIASRGTSLTTAEKMVLSDIYSVVASYYTITHQSRRALDSFEQSYSHDEENTQALYGIAYNVSDSNPGRCVSLLFEFLGKAPTCDKQYPNVLYHLSLLNFTMHKVNEAGRYFQLAQLYEKYRLPFLPEVDTTAKTTLTAGMPLLIARGNMNLEYCYNPLCARNESGNLKSCTRCKSVYYCGKDCQSKDWNFHKQACKSMR